MSATRKWGEPMLVEPVGLVFLIMRAARCCHMRSLQLSVTVGLATRRMQGGAAAWPQVLSSPSVLAVGWPDARTQTKQGVRRLGGDWALVLGVKFCALILFLFCV